MRVGLQVTLGHGPPLREALLRMEEENKGAMHVDPWCAHRLLCAVVRFVWNVAAAAQGALLSQLTPCFRC